jgi:hypothetical protein
VIVGETRIESKGRAWVLATAVAEKGVTPELLAALKVRAEMSEDYLGKRRRPAGERLDMHMLHLRLSKTVG